MSEERVKRKLSAILSADVVGYSRLMGEDEVSTVRTLEAYRRVMSDLIEQFRGRVVDSPGDNLLSEFSSVVDAVQCAVEIHEVIRAKNEELPEDRRMLFRIGVNLGDVIEEGERIYGDGVNIAARLEGLAEAGGICISGSAHEQIENKLALGYEFLGEHTVKNIAKPVKVYKVPMGLKIATPTEEDKNKIKLKNWQWVALGVVGTMVVIIGALVIWNFYLRGPSIEPASVEKMAYPLPDKTSIAVLPFKNESGDPEQDYIGNGLSRSICDALSVSSQMFVIDRNATFIYKETPVKPQQVAKDLGVQYILDGSIQKSGDRIRVTVQLTDALAGHYLWSDKYDREMIELFEIEDEITKKIMVSLQVELSGNEDLRVYAKSTDNLEAWKYYIKGVELCENAIEKNFLKAQEYFETALEFDPTFVAALSMLAETHAQGSMFEWGDSQIFSLNRALELAKKAVELNEQDPSAHAILGRVFLDQRLYEKAITEGKRAITLNPNYAYGHVMLAYIMHFFGRFDEAITLSKKADRLNPVYKSINSYVMATSYIFLERYEEALEILRQMEEHDSPGSRPDAITKTTFSWVYQELGREEGARAYMAEALKIKPDYSLENSVTDPYKDPAHLQRMLDAYRKAGMPERAPGAVQEKPSIAVLPFDDLSPEKDQEYFVLGLSEEILNSLTQIPDLTVIAKTSSFSFRGTNKKIHEIADELGVNHILEGSVRKAGNALRITAQLIKAVDGSHLWSETYDKEFRVEEIFSVQEDIAMGVADELKVTLGIGKPIKQLGGTENIEAYELYLVARGQLVSLEYNRALESIDAALALDHEFANAWALKAEIHIQFSISGPSNRADTELEAALIAAQKAIELEPNLSEGYFELSRYESSRGNWIDAESNYRKALQLQPERISQNVMGVMGDMYNTVGYFKKSREIYEEYRRNDPLNESARMIYVMTLGLLRDTEGIENENERCKALFGDEWNAYSWGIVYHRLGTGDAVSRDGIEYSNLIFNAVKEYLDSPKEGLAKLRQLYSDENNLSELNITNISILAAYFGDPEFAMDALEKGNEKNALGLFKVWYPVMTEVRQLPRFKEFVRKIGLVDYWKEFGWPDLCRPVGDDDFVCD